MNPMLLAGLIALACSYALTPVARALAGRWGVIAHPGGRRVHTRATPLMGGAAIYASFTAAVLVTVAVSPDLSLNAQTVGVILGATLVALVGVLDDRFELPGLVQALSIVAGGVVLYFFGVKVIMIMNPLTDRYIVLGFFSIPVTLLWVLMVTKAVDCMDGLDGLAAGISAIAAATLMLMAARTGGRELSSVMAAAVVGGSLGFLRYNYPPAKIFMGTVGAQFLGFVLAAISILGAVKIAALFAVAVPILVLAVPLLDTTFVVVRRMLSGKKIHEADTTHLHHRLVNKGLSHRQAIWIIYLLTIISCVVAYVIYLRLYPVS